ncbi:MAG TPA: alpha-L-fucosidase [Phycisphaerae bacterium]|nr:alpha-L-fucosidase [Phycisphaerae bacterium]
MPKPRKLSRRTAVKLLSAVPAALLLPRPLRAQTTPASTPATAPTSAPANLPPKPTFAESPRILADGPFKATWESLKQYKTPDWFRDAKFGLWAHWSAQCVPEQGDWYARNMYIQGERQNTFHTRTYGHPSQFGFMEIDNLWKAEKWDPAALLDRYKKAGAKYFVALANHHDNFDNYDSTHHEWNSVRVGPKKDLIKGWADATRNAGLRFGVTNHSAHSWHWFQVAYDYDPTGDKAGQRYDAFRLTKADGKGKWWEGLDPQALYNGPIYVMPDGITTVAAANQFHTRTDRNWNENPPPNNPEFVARWFARCQELLDRYEPDLLYFDNTGLPLGQAGLDIAAHFYNSNLKRKGQLEAVLNAKQLRPNQVGALVMDIERGAATDIRPDPWQTDTCIGDWHYNRALYTGNRYKTPLQVVQMLIDIVSKNGNLLLSIPVRGDGSIDDLEIKVLDGIAAWMQQNSEGIYATRPWKVFGEGPSTASAPAGQFGGTRDVRPYTADDIRFTAKGDTLFAFLMGWPNTGKATLKSLAKGSGKFPREVAKVELLGSGERPFTQDDTGLTVSLPDAKPNDFAYCLKITPK